MNLLQYKYENKDGKNKMNLQILISAFYTSEILNMILHHF